MPAWSLRPACLAAALFAAVATTVVASPPAAAEEAAAAKTSRPDVPGETIVAPSPRLRERLALRQLLAERNTELAELRARAAAAPEAEQAELQAGIEQHKRATRLALLDRQMTFAQARGDIGLVRRLEQYRSRAAALVTAPVRGEVAR